MKRNSKRFLKKKNFPQKRKEAKKKPLKSPKSNLSQRRRKREERKRKRRLLKQLKLEAGGDFNPDLIRWVLTVPAIWKDKAKQFMREAFYQVND